MSVPAINQLANMEYMLYGGRSGMNLNCPSMYNGYVGTTNSIFNNGMGMYNPAFYGSNTGFGQSVPSNYTQTGVSQSQNANTSFQQGITQEDMDKLADYYAKNSALEEGFVGAAAGGLSWMAFEHAQSIFHPKNAWKGFKTTKEMFKSLPKEFAAKNAALLQEAQIAVQQTVRDTGSKGWWSKWLRRPLYLEKTEGMTAEQIAINNSNKAEVTKALEAMKKAIEHQNPEEIAKATEQLQATRGMDGRIAGTLTGRKSVAERLAQKEASISKKSAELVNINNSVIKNEFGNLIKSSLKRDFVGFMIFESIFNAGKIMTAFEQDTTTGLKQTGQSLGKSALGTAGWCVGRAAGTLLAAKVGASIGIAGGPVGAAVGALIGFTVGSIGMWAGHKLGNKIFGHDVADKVEAKKLVQTKEGQVQLLQFAAEKAQEGKTDAATNQIVYKALNAYA